MKVLCYGSLNIDHVYRVPHFVEAGETLSSSSLEVNPGGKGANQAAALAKAGCETYMAGKLGSDGLMLKDTLESYGVDCSHVVITDNPSGHAIIQLDENCQNSIILFPGENRNIKTEEIDTVLSDFDKGDWLILQNEINNLSYLIKSARKKGMVICFNPAPFDESVLSLPIADVDLFVVNEVEGSGMAGLKDAGYTEILDSLRDKFPTSAVIMTVGANGSYYQKGDKRVYHEAIKCTVKDTTAAGDTFIGFFIASRIQGFSVEKSLDYATKASSIAVSRSGAMASVPYCDEVFKQVEDKKSAS